MNSEITSLKTVSELLGRSGPTARRFVERHHLVERRSSHIVVPVAGLCEVLKTENVLIPYQRAWNAYHNILGPRARVEAAYLFERRMAEICREGQAELDRVSNLPERTPRADLRYYDFVEYADVWPAWAPVQIALEWLGGVDGRSA